MENITIYSSDNRMPRPLSEEFFALMEQAFPKSERHDYNGFLGEYRHPRFRSMCCCPDGFAAALNFYDFDDFIKLPPSS